jgi:hypothetical protein
MAICASIMTALDLSFQRGRNGSAVRLNGLIEVSVFQVDGIGDGGLHPDHLSSARTAFERMTSTRFVGDMAGGKKAKMI